jgi:hypothetical protein
MFAEPPTIAVASDSLIVKVANEEVARYRYWNDELRERHLLGSISRTGGELLVRRGCLEAHLNTGATLCWVAKLSVQQREKYTERFEEPQVVGTWVVGGSRMVWPQPWWPPTPME